MVDDSIDLCGVVVEELGDEVGELDMPTSDPSPECTTIGDNSVTLYPLAGTRERGHITPSMVVSRCKASMKILRLSGDSSESHVNGIGSKRTIRRNA